MNGKRGLMRILLIAAGVFGYFYLGHFQIGFRLLFMILGFITIMIYTVESVKNNYNKISIQISILVATTLIVLFVNEIIEFRYSELLYLQGYFMALLAVLIITIMIVGAVNYISVSNKKNGIIMIIILSFIMLDVIFVIIIIILKKYGVIR
jgi:hypothetical protein